MLAQHLFPSQPGERLRTGLLLGGVDIPVALQDAPRQVGHVIPLIAVIRDTHVLAEEPGGSAPTDLPNRCIWLPASLT